MGYFELSVNGSDFAADAAASLVDNMVKALKKSLQEEGNEYNTSGPVNVAMIFDEIIIPSTFFKDHNYDKLQEIAVITREKLQEEYIKVSGIKTNDIANKKYHCNKYKSLLNRLDKFIN